MIFCQELKNYKNERSIFHESIRIIFFIIFLIYSMVVNANVKEIYPFDSPIQSKQFNQLTAQLRCLVCQNENLADSGSDFAKDIMQQIYNMVKQDKSNKVIKQYLVKRYGDFILYDPPFDAVTIMLWLTPLFLLLIGGVIFFKVLKKQPSVLEPSQDDV